ncbi:MAG: thiamine-phosphate kinase, partial [Nitrosopumilaceae archaeon]|nr:thiamine-phosphate kinase [Nitrosopumilaceae archaeon]
MTNLTEKEIIQIIQKKLNKKFVSEDVEEFRLGKTNFLAKTDTLVQSTDIPSKMQIGNAVRKSIVACISDFAAKGTKPQFGIMSINFPKKTSKHKVEEIANAIKLASKEFSLKILGGDMNEGKEFVFQVCIFGQADSIPKRKGAKIGDLIFVTGFFGYTGIGLEIMLNSKKINTKLKNKAIKAVIQPIHRLEFGIKNKKYFTSSMDSSDGLSTTLIEMAR